LALATGGFEAIAKDAGTIFREKGVEIDWKVLEIAGGYTVEYHDLTIPRQQNEEKTIS
jgi:homoserine kinase